jgi:predicted  nucleic acid-binding Zn-ribbon protein
MVLFDMFQRALGMDSAAVGPSNCQSQCTLACENPSAYNQSSYSSSYIASVGSSVIEGTDSRTHSESKSMESVICTSNTQEKEIARLRQAIKELKTSGKAKEVLLHSTREELKNAHDALAETFAECSSLRDEIKTTKQNITRDHQAVVYGKDLELFALRKSNERKAGYIKEHDAKRETIHQQHTDVESNGAQLHELTDHQENLKNEYPSNNNKVSVGDRALEVRLLRVKKCNVPDSGEDKDATIAQLQRMLALATEAADDVRNQQDELQRAWDITKKSQDALKNECDSHEQTKEQLQELIVRFAEEEHKHSRRNSVIRLPTIDENKHELEAMFDTAQENNLRLHAEVEALEKRLRDSNIRMFNAQQQAEALRNQVRFEKAVNKDLEAANPNVIHRVYYHRIEEQLNESQDALATTAKQIEVLKRRIVGKDDYIKDLQTEIEAANNFHIFDQDEIESLKRSVTELQAAKEQLVMDREFVASQHLRQRSPLADRTSVRSSGATLINALGLQLMRSVEEASPIEAPPSRHSSDTNEAAAPIEASSTTPAPSVNDELVTSKAIPPLLISIQNDPETDRNNSIQLTPTRHLRQEPPSNRWSLMSNDIPPPELRQSRRKSLGFKGLMKKIIRKDTKTEKVVTEEEKSESRTALGSRNRSSGVRPRTAATNRTTRKRVVQEFFHAPAVKGVPRDVGPPNERGSGTRYCTAQSQSEVGYRPKTAAGGFDADNTEAGRLENRRSWGAT